MIQSLDIKQGKNEEIFFSPPTCQTTFERAEKNCKINSFGLKCFGEIIMESVGANIYGFPLSVWKANNQKKKLGIHHGESFCSNI